MTLTKDDFPVGTRVRVTNFAFEDSNPQVGTTGTAFVDVRRDGKPADDEFPYRASELEVIDRVERTGPDLPSRLAVLDAEIATEKAAIQGIAAGLDTRRRDLNRKTTLAAQYRAVLEDLEAQQ